MNFMLSYDEMRPEIGPHTIVHVETTYTGTKGDCMRYAGRLVSETPDCYRVYDQLVLIEYVSGKEPKRRLIEIQMGFGGAFFHEYECDPNGSPILKKFGYI